MNDDDSSVLSLSSAAAGIYMHITFLFTYSNQVIPNAEFTLIFYFGLQQLAHTYQWPGGELGLQS